MQEAIGLGLPAESLFSQYRNQALTALRGRRLTATELNYLSQGLSSPLDKPDVVEAIGNLVVKIGDKLPQYDTFISDEASARLVSIILRRTAMLLSGESKNVIFLSLGIRSDNSTFQAVDRYLDAKSRSFGKSLFVTEFVYTGRSLFQAMDLMDGKAIDYDIAAVSSCLNVFERRGIKKDFYVGRSGDTGYDLSYKTDEYGVVKDSRVISPHPVRRIYKPEVLQNARKSAFTLSQRLAQVI